MFEHPTLLQVAIGSFLFQLSFYLILGVGGFWLAHRSRVPFFVRRRMPHQVAGREQIVREVKLSFITMVIISVVGVIFMMMMEQGWIKICFDLSCGGPLYAIAMVAVLVVAHDAYFYWTHRMLHTPWLFKHFHIDHHRSLFPTPLAILAHHPVDSILSVGFVYVIVFFVPIPLVSIIGFQIIMYCFNLLGHLNLELLPERFLYSRWFKVLNTSTHHQLHHQTTQYNHGFYFSFWDRWFGTEHPEINQAFLANTRCGTPAEMLPNP